MRKFPFIFIPLQIFYLSFPLLYEIPTLIPFIPTPNSLYSYPDSPHSHYFDPDSRIPIIPLIPFSDSPFRLLQVGEKFLDFALTT